MSTRFNGIIQGPTDSDFYFTTMKAAVRHWYPDVEIEKAYTCRTKGVDHSFLKGILEEEIKKIGQFSYSANDIANFSKVPYFKPSYIRFLSSQRWNPDDVRLTYLPDGGLDIRIRGPWVNVMDWELYILPIISECYHKYMLKKHNVSEAEAFQCGLTKLQSKIDLLKKKAPKLKFIDMGTRRRSSFYWQEGVLLYILKNHPDCLAGTSNVLLANELGIPFFGTHAHEWDCGHLAFTSFLKAKQLSMLRWMEAFEGNAGVCLTDTFTTKHFLSVFNKFIANAYTGVRHDSGPWDVWAKMMIDHYVSLGIDPKTKTLVFSDSLDFPEMIEIFNALDGICKVGFGIGTNLMNDMMDLWKALSIVIKMTMCDGIDVLKISDDYQKTMCENQALKAYAFNVFQVGN